MRGLVPKLFGLLCVAWLGACLPAAPPPPADNAPRVREIHVTSNGWHTAIVVPRREALSVGALPEADDLPEAAFLEFGWGDRAYYSADEPTLGMALEAALTETPAVLHMAGLSQPPQASDPGPEVVSLNLTRRGFAQLVRSLAGAFKRADGKRGKPIAPGLVAESYFYEAHGRFHLFNNCNRWTARMLRAGGVDISPSGIVTAKDLMTRIRKVPQNGHSFHRTPAEEVALDFE